eukprot:12767549-Heterocapsa_arctica.AAC.1
MENEGVSLGRSCFGYPLVRKVRVGGGTGGGKGGGWEAVLGGLGAVSRGVERGVLLGPVLFLVRSSAPGAN